MLPPRLVLTFISSHARIGFVRLLLVSYLLALKASPWRLGTLGFGKQVHVHPLTPSRLSSHTLSLSQNLSELRSARPPTPKHTCPYIIHAEAWHLQVAMATESLFPEANPPPTPRDPMMSTSCLLLENSSAFGVCQ